MSLPTFKFLDGTTPTALTYYSIQGNPAFAENDPANPAWPSAEITLGGEPLSGSNQLPVTLTSIPLATGAAQDGTDSTGIVQLTGGVGIRGWLSGIFHYLSLGLTAATAPFVEITDGTHFLPTMDAAARAGFVKVTDGTNVQPTLDVVARAGFVKLTDGTNTAPTMDAVARAGFQKLTDGTNVAAVKAASTAPVATDPASVVTVSPNSNAAVHGTGRTVSQTMTVVATTHNQFTVFGTLMDFANVARVTGGRVSVRRIRIAMNQIGLVAQFRVHFFNVNTATLATDGNNYKALYADESKKAGESYAFNGITASPADGTSDISACDESSMYIPLQCVTQDVFVLVEMIYSGLTSNANLPVTVTMDFVDES